MKREHQAGEEDGPARNKTLFCLKLVARTACHSHQQQEIIEQIEEHNPLFVVSGSNQPLVMREKVCEDQRRNMKYFAHLADSHISSKSVAAMPELTIRGLVHLTPEASQQHLAYAVARIDDEAEGKKFEDALNKAMRNQQKMDGERFFMFSRPSNARCRRHARNT